MKTPDQAVPAVRTLFHRHWPAVVLSGDESRWPVRIPLGSPPKADIEADFPAVQRWALGWLAWADQQPVTLEMTTRMVHGTRQQLPSHMIVDTVADTLTLLGSEADTTITLARERADALRGVAVPGSISERHLRAVVDMSEGDFSMLLAAVAWLRENDPAGLTPRQVPIPGVHGKWLNTRESMLTALTGRESLGFADARPARVHFTYLDPGHLATGARRFDVSTAGDQDSPAYLPDVVLISENKDTAVVFPPMVGGIAVEGSGYSGHARHVPWIRECPDVVYWGDVDTDGLAIVNMYRDAGIPVRTILMDLAAFDEFAEFGTRTMPNGDPIVPTVKTLPHLTASEQALYDRLTDPTWDGPLRIEQERIPLDRAHALATVPPRVPQAGRA